MIKLVCNLCKKDIENTEFMFEAAIIEVIPVVVAKDIVDPPKQQKKTLIHVCKDCFDKKLRKEIYGV
jgi:hypothetical protein